MSSYNLIRERVSNLPTVNDAAERDLGLLTEFHSKTSPQNEEQKQYLFKVVKELRAQQGDLATSSERVTKKTISSINVNSL